MYCSQHCCNPSILFRTGQETPETKKRKQKRKKLSKTSAQKHIQMKNNNVLINMLNRCYTVGLTAQLAANAQIMHNYYKGCTFFSHQVFKYKNCSLAKENEMYSEL